MTNVKKVSGFASLALAALLVGSMVVAGPATAAYAQSESVSFVSNVEMIKGHMSQAIKNVKAGEIELALAHAGHPIEEHYAALAPEINGRNAALGTELEAALADFANSVDSMSAGEVRAQAAAISRLMNSAVSEVVPEETLSDPAFRAAVINTLILSERSTLRR
jgi:hypothetical protein